MRGGGLFSCDTQYCADTNNIHEAAEAFMKFSRYAGNKQNYENDINKFKKYVQGQCYTNGKNVHTMKPCKGKAFQIDELVNELWTGTNKNKTSKESLITNKPNKHSIILISLCLQISAYIPSASKRASTNHKQRFRK